MKEEIPLIYLWIYKRMIEKYGKVNQLVRTKDLLEVIRRTIFHLPGQYYFFILKDMAKLKLVEKVNMQKYKLLGAQADKKLRLINDYFFW